MAVAAPPESRSLLTTEKLSLVPIDLRDPVQYAEFKRQRVICGWAWGDDRLQGFAQKQEQNLKSLFWIMIPPNRQANGANAGRVGKNATPDTNANSAEHAAAYSNAGLASADSFTIRAGHISLDSYAEPPDDELAREDRSILTVQTFFILPEYRSGGLGRAAMNLIEVLAKQEPYGSPQCHTLALTTLSTRYVNDEGPEGRGIWEQFGLEIPSFSNQDWYQKLGYVYWKEEPRYRVPNLKGDIIDMVGAFMRKKLRE